MRGGIRQDAEKKRSGASTIRRKRRGEGESGVVWTSGERDVASGRKKRCDVASGRKERCDASQDAQDARDAEYPALSSGRNAGGSDARSVFADVCGLSLILSSHLCPMLPMKAWLRIVRMVKQAFVFPSCRPGLRIMLNIRPCMG